MHSSRSSTAEERDVVVFSYVETVSVGSEELGGRAIDAQRANRSINVCLIYTPSMYAASSRRGRGHTV